jgi:DNA polymerase I
MTAAMPTIYDWDKLPFREIWSGDAEYYPGVGYANGGRDGDPITPLCLVALELRSGRLVRIWQNEFGPFPPYRLDPDALFMSYGLAAEFGVHLARGWGEPARALDALVEFRHYTNVGSIKAGDRDKGFYSLGGALRYFLEDEIDVARKTAIRDRILQGPPFSAQEQQEILAYCEDDVRALARLIPHLIPTIRSLPHALARAKYQWAMAVQERRGVPVDLPMLTRIRGRWQDMRLDLVSQLDQPFGCYEVINGVAHWRKKLFEDLVRRKKA